MNVKESYAALQKKYPELKFEECVEYSDRYVFSPKTYIGKDRNKTILDQSLYVMKSDGEIAPFLPSMISTEEYFSGKKINFKMIGVL